MTRHIKTADDLDEYQRTVVAGLIARREFDLGYRLSKPQRQIILNGYLTALNAEIGTRPPRTSRPGLPPVADYRWQPPTPMRRSRGR